jgi:hypothetical protein
LLDEVELISRHLEEIKRHYTRKLKEEPDYKIPGWQLASGAPKRAVSDWPAARAKLEEYVQPQALDAVANYNVTEIERVLGEAIGVKGEKRKAELKRVLGDLLELKYPEPSLKRTREI